MPMSNGAMIYEAYEVQTGLPQTGDDITGRPLVMAPIGTGSYSFAKDNQSLQHGQQNDDRLALEGHQSNNNNNNNNCGTPTTATKNKRPRNVKQAYWRPPFRLTELMQRGRGQAGSNRQIELREGGQISLATVSIPRGYTKGRRQARAAKVGVAPRVELGEQQNEALSWFASSSSSSKSENRGEFNRRAAHEQMEVHTEEDIELHHPQSSSSKRGKQIQWNKPPAIQRMPKMDDDSTATLWSPTIRLTRSSLEMDKPKAANQKHNTLADTQANSSATPTTLDTAPLGNQEIGPTTETHPGPPGQPTGRRHTDTTGTAQTNSTKKTHTEISERQEAEEQANNDDKLVCRLEKDIYYAIEPYSLFTCAMCYSHMHPGQFHEKLAFDPKSRMWLSDAQGNRYLANETDRLKATFKAEDTFNKWLDCCLHAIECCRRNFRSTLETSELVRTNSSSGDQFIRNENVMEANVPNDSLEIVRVDRRPSSRCPATWDGLSCWESAQASTLVNQKCPEYVYFLAFTPVCRGDVTKRCFENGSWFQRGDHEWSNYQNCGSSPERTYALRLIVGSGWHIFSAFIIGPALMVLQKLPNRGGSKRVRILRNLLFWLLVNGLLAATQKLGTLGGFFRPPQAAYNQPRGLTSSGPSINSGAANRMIASFPVPTIANNSSEMATKESNYSHLASFERPGLSSRFIEATSHRHLLTPFQAAHYRAENRLRLHIRTLTEEPIYRNQLDGPASWHPYTQSEIRLFPGNIVTTASSTVPTDMDATNGPTQPITTTTTTTSTTMDSGGRLDDGPDNHQIATDSHNPEVPREPLKDRFKRDNSSRSPIGQEAALKFVCWLVSVALRITRLLVYGWMFTGAVYLCSVLHFAPAEPPGPFIKWLMVSTNAIPVLLGLIYTVARSVHEPSPMNLLGKLPYYYLKGDTDKVKALWGSELVCWLLQSNNDSIEEIADFPNLVLIILNSGLFVVTLIIMCRISRPGSTRPGMSLSDYFKAAGTLVLLYGAHYALVAYKPPEQSCVQGQVIYYSTLFVDGVQGIAVAYVFCYKTPEGKDIIAKWCDELIRSLPNWCNKRIMVGYRARGHSTNPERRINQSKRSNNSGCNGKELTTELTNIDTTPRASEF